MSRNAILARVRPARPTDADLDTGFRDCRWQRQQLTPERPEAPDADA